MKSLSPTDRERAELRGSVRTIVDDWSTTVFDRDGKIMEWRGNTLHGYSERMYSYDENEKLIRITGSDGDQLDEFRYDEQGRMTQIRHVPARTEGPKATSFEVSFEVISEGEILTDGGTVETSYNERGQPVERLIVDDAGVLLFRIVHLYDANGRLGEERLVGENLSFPKVFRDQIPREQRAAVLTQMKTAFENMMRQQTGLFGNAERTYVYDGQGRAAERHMRMGSVREDLAWTYNDRGDMVESTRQTSGFPHEFGGLPEQHWKCRYSYEYDEHGNWMKRSETWEVGGNTTAGTRARHLTYYS